MYEENRYLAFHMSDAGHIGAAANQARAVLRPIAANGLQPCFWRIDVDRSPVCWVRCFVTCVCRGGVQKCFKPELQTSQIMTVL